MSLRYRVESRLFVLAKEGAGVEECEDAAAADDAARAYSVADGATEAFDARRWARRLADEWVGAARPPVCAEEFGAWVAAQGEWLHAQWAEGGALPWYAEEKRRAGSFAAFVGVRFERESEATAGARGQGGNPVGVLSEGVNTVGASSERGNTFGGSGVEKGVRWRAVALGDSCLVQRRAGSLVVALPIASAADFNSTPPLVPSLEALREAALARAVFREGEAAAGDALLLMSDAAAAWFFDTQERARARLEEFDSLVEASENEPLAEFLRVERREGRLKDDDVAIVSIKVLGS